MMKMKTIFVMMAVMFVSIFSTACNTEDVPPGHKAFLFDRTGGAAFYSGGDGLVADKVLKNGTHYTGFYDKLVGVNCRDAHVKEPLRVLTQSDMEVTVDLRVTYAADCSSVSSMNTILNKVGVPTEGTFVQPPQIFEKYVMPIIRESLRNHLSSATLEEIKNIRGELAEAVKKDLETSIQEKDFPVGISVLTVSKITLPEEIRMKIKEIEIARMEANKEEERMAAAKVRLERELFEAQQDRKVKNENAEKAKDVATIKAEADLEVKKREAEGIAAIRRQLSGSYLSYLQLERETEVKKKMAESLGKGTTYYMSGTDFLVPPGSGSSVSVGN